MKRKNRIQKLLVAMPLILAVQVVFAAFTSTISGHSGKKSESTKYSLNNVGRFSNRGLSLNTVRYSYQLRPVELGTTRNHQTGLVSNNASTVQFTKGNTTFIYPYKVKVKVPKFKAPSPTGN
jgi:hypothetical protein